MLAAAPAAAQKPMASHDSTRPRGETAAVVARVNGVAIGSADLQAAIDARLPPNSSRQKLAATKLAAMRREALDSLIDEELRYQEAVRLGVRVTPQEVEKAFDRARQAYPGGVEAFELALRGSAATETQVRSSIRRGLMVRKVYQQAVGNACRVSEAEASTYYRENRQRFVKPFAEVKTRIVRDLTETRCADARARWSKQLRNAARIQQVSSQGTP